MQLSRTFVGSEREAAKALAALVTEVEARIVDRTTVTLISSSRLGWTTSARRIRRRPFTNTSAGSERASSRRSVASGWTNSGQAISQVAYLSILFTTSTPISSRIRSDSSSSYAMSKGPRCYATSFAVGIRARNATESKSTRLKTSWPSSTRCHSAIGTVPEPTGVSRSSS